MITWKVIIGHGDNYTTGCLLDYSYFKEYYKMKAIDLSKWQVIDADQKAIQWSNNVFHNWRIEKKYFRFFTRKRESIVNLLCFNIVSK